MLVRRCDRCGAHYETNEVGVEENMLQVNRVELQKVKESETKYKSVSGERFDLCQACVEELIDWLKRPKRQMAVRRETPDDGKKTETDE